MGLPASSSAQLVFHFAYFLLSLSLDAPNTNSAAAAASPFFFSFDFTNTSSYRSDDLRFEGNVSVQNNLIDLTCSSIGETINGCAGRMSYGHPVPFYDNTTLASFSTRFTFAIKFNNETKNKGEGMAFFLAYYPSSMPSSSGGGNLGLLGGDGRNTAFDEGRFVAIEFDTFNNLRWDPSDNYDHIGIDISSMRSCNTTSLGRIWLNGSMTASITFDNTTRMLVASLQFAHNTSLGTFEVSTILPDPRTLLPPEVAVGFSAATGMSAELHQIMSWSFNSTLAPPQINSTLAPPQKGTSYDKKATILIGGSIFGGALVLVLLVWFIISWCNWTSKRDAFERGTGGTRRFEYRDLAAATDNFSEQKKLGQGSFGAVYRGTSLKGLVGEVAVKKILEDSKKISKDSKERHADFFAELNNIGAAKHKNLVKLEGWCCRATSWNMLDFMCWCRRKKNDEVFLVYELVPNGDLFDHLHNRGAEVLPWPTRYKIVKDIGAALLYLHEECRPYILHRDIKPGNILLDMDFNAKLADFGLSRVSNQDNATLLTNAVGTERYLDPQCRKDGEVKFNRSCDIYSFGVVLLEIACREDISMEQVWHLYRENTIVQAADDKLDGEFDAREMERVIVLGLWCSHSDRTKRPDIREAMNILERDPPLPDLNSLNTLVST